MNKPKLAMVVAATAYGEIGFNNDLPWKLRGDLKNFKLLTDGMPIIMGRKTAESLPNGGQALPGRVNIVVSSKWPEFSHEDGFTVCRTIDDAIEYASRFGTDWIYFIGGAKIYEDALELVERVALTLVHKPGIYDTRINNFVLPAGEWELVEQSPTVMDINQSTGFPTPSHTYLDYRRIAR